LYLYRVTDEKIIEAELEDISFNKERIFGFIGFGESEQVIGFWS
jgi:hypothetical protein